MLHVAGSVTFFLGVHKPESCSRDGCALWMLQATAEPWQVVTLVTRAEGQSLGMSWELSLSLGHKKKQQQLWVGEGSTIQAPRELPLHICGFRLIVTLTGTMHLWLNILPSRVIFCRLPKAVSRCDIISKLLNICTLRQYHKMTSCLGVILWWLVCSLIICFIPKMVAVTWRWVQGEPWVFQSLTPEASGVPCGLGLFFCLASLVFG